MRPSQAALIAAVAVVVALVLGLAAGRVARPPAPTPRFVSITTSPVPTPSPTPVDEEALMRQPLSSGCATQQSVWLVTNGGGLLRWDGTTWSQVDSTLRSLTRVVCGPARAYAVGLVGSIVIGDEATRQISTADFGIDDLFGVATLGDGALLTGTRGTVYILASGDLQPYASGIEEDLRDVVAFSRTSAWAVGQDGISYRLDQRGWRPIATGQRSTLRSVAATSAADPVAVGDGGAIVRFENGAWRGVPSGVAVDLRDIAMEPSALWIVGDGGTLLTGTLADGLRRVDLKTTCDLVSVFTRGSAEVWVVGVKGPGGAVWQLGLDGSVKRHWGAC